MTKELRIGITMRQANACTYHEPREGLAVSWKTFIHATLPEAIWVPLPSIGPAIEHTATQLQLNGIILSGGEDIGSNPARDATEQALLTWCCNTQTPLLGICRGMQQIQSHMGGTISKGAVPDHINTRHLVTFTPSASAQQFSSPPRVVNSYHANSIPADQIAHDLFPLALDQSGQIEALHAKKLPLLGLMWHPERNEEPDPHDMQLIRTLFS